jgi:osmotically-inducible protein OsmY
MIIRKSLTAAVAAAALLTLIVTGCAVTRGQETVGSYVDDAAVTTKVKSAFVEDKTVDAASIHVETLNGTVKLSGFAKSSAERAQAEYLARRVNGAKMVQNDISVRP